MDHNTVIKETRHLASTREQGVGPKLSLLSVYHLLTESCPRVRMDREDNKNLEWMEPPKWGLVRISGDNEG